MHGNIYYHKALAVWLLALISPAVAINTTINITTDGVIGSNATIICAWTTAQGEIAQELRIGALPSKYFYSYTIGREFQPVAKADRDIRHSVDQTSPQDTNVTMRISNLQCSDELEFLCNVTQSGGELPNIHVSKKLTVTVAPQAPKIVKSDPTQLNRVAEHANVSITCNANLGRPGKGQIRWRIYRGDVADEIQPSDSRIVEYRNATLQPGDPSCTERVETTFRMRVTRNDQKLAIACFVINSDYPPSTLPATCDNKEANRCDQTMPIEIHYPVTNVTVGSEPATNTIYQGDTVTLICFAEGFPSPSYTWVKADNENRTLTGSLDDSGYKLVLRNVKLEEDAGSYNCTASNNVLGTVFSVTNDLNLLILQTTTTSTVSTTASTTTMPVSVASGEQQEQGGSSDDTSTIIIAVVVPVVCILIIVVVVVCLCKHRKSRKAIEEPSEKPYNNRTNLSFQGNQPDLVADEKKFNGSLNNSFDVKNEDGLMYADLTYDNRPRSRKPMAITDTASEYSSIEMPQV